MNKILTLFPLLCFTFLSQAQTPTLTRDINTNYLSSNPTVFFAHGNTLFFTAINNTTQGNEFWKTDGTDSGTVLVKDIYAGAGSSNPNNYCSVGSLIFFTAHNGINGVELWRSDGTEAGTFLVKDIRSGGASSSPTKLTNYNGKLLFAADNGTNGQELWISDGSDSGTVMVKDIRTGSASATIADLVVYGNKAYFTANDGTYGSELWVSDGSDTGTTLLKDIRVGSSASSITGTTVFKNKLYFAANDGTTGIELWTSDGTDTGTVIYQDHVKGAGGCSPSLFTVVNNTLFFKGSNAVYGTELMKINGTDTIQVIDVDPNGSSTPADLTNVAGTLFFTATVDNGRELYVSDGTQSGTKLTRDLYPIQTDGLIRFMTVVDSTLFFTAHESPNYQDYELYAATPSSPYPRRVKDIVVGAASNPMNLTAFKGKLFFSVNDQVNGNEMWTATAKTADLFKDIYQGTQGAGIQSMAALNGSIIFNAISSVGDELWKSSGDSSSTDLLKDVVSGTGSSQPRDLFSTGQDVFFKCNSSATSIFNKTNGTAAGTNYISITGGSTSMKEYVWHNDVLYFSRGSSSIYDLLYAYTPKSGAYKIRNLNPSNLGDYAANLTLFRNEIYFSADDGNTNGNELFKSNGTYAGTVLVKDIYPDYYDAYPGNLTVVDTMLYFTANNGKIGKELWITDGTSSGTKLVKDIYTGAASGGVSNIVSFRNKAFFTANDGQSGVELWSSDGTASGTNLFLDINSGAGGSYPNNLLAVDTLLYFVVNDSIHGSELWVSNGTAAGTHLLKDIKTGPESANIKNMIQVRNYLYFTADNGINGQELWRTDGTSSGTQMLPEVYAGAMSSNPNLLTLVGDTLYYTADHPFYGNELWWVFTNCMVSGMQANNTCVGDTISFVDKTESLGTTISSYAWDFGDSYTANTATFNHAYAAPGTYTVSLTVMNTLGCTINTKKTVDIRATPQVNFATDKDTQCFKANAVKFSNNSTAAIGEPLIWHFGDGQTSSIENPTYNYKTAGTFTAKLIVGASAKCSDTASKTIVINLTPGVPTISGKTTTYNNYLDSFTVAPAAGSTYQWTVTNGTIMNGQGTAKIVVQWKVGTTTAIVETFETNAKGCAGDVKKLNIGLSKLGVDDQLKNIGFEIYPNPSNGLITLNKKAIDNQKYTVIITDVIGNIVQQYSWNEMANNNQLAIDIRQQKAGVYQITVATEQSRYSAKVVLLKQ
jgi:ELWxxDGT repeat protein